MLTDISDDDLRLIFSRFGPILSCEVIRDKRTGDSLQYAFIEFENQKDCEQAYFKMQGVLIDDHRIHVDFSQSVGAPVLLCLLLALLTSYAGFETAGKLATRHSFKTWTPTGWFWWHSQPREETPVQGV